MLKVNDENIKLLNDTSASIIENSSNVGKAATILQNALDENMDFLGPDGHVQEITKIVEDIQQLQSRNEKVMNSVGEWLSVKAKAYQDYMDSNFGTGGGTAGGNP